MIYNPYRVIRELERKLEFVELARVKAEDECRVLHAQLTTARESESQARRDLLAKTERFEDWMASLMHQRPVHGAEFERQPAPPPARRPAAHGAALEAQMIAQFEKDLGIDQPN